MSHEKTKVANRKSTLKAKPGHAKSPVFKHDKSERKDKKNTWREVIA